MNSPYATGGEDNSGYIAEADNPAKKTHEAHSDGSEASTAEFEPVRVRREELAVNLLPDTHIESRPSRRRELQCE